MLEDLGSGNKNFANGAISVYGVPLADGSPSVPTARQASFCAVDRAVWWTKANSTPSAFDLLEPGTILSAVRSLLPTDARA